MTRSKGHKISSPRDWSFALQLFRRCQYICRIFFKCPFSGKKYKYYSSKTTWFSGKHWRKFWGKRTSAPPPPPPPQRNSSRTPMNRGSFKYYSPTYHWPQYQRLLSRWWPVTAWPWGGMFPGLSQSTGTSRNGNRAMYGPGQSCRDSSIIDISWKM